MSGYSGIGKSSVVHELHRPIVGRRGRVRRRASSSSTSATSRTSRSSRPSASSCSTSWPRARQSIARVAAAASRRRWGTNGQLVVDLIPQLGLVIGPQPPVPELPPTEAENRLRLVLAARSSARSPRQEHPLALFLDDLQWADAASLKLLAEPHRPTPTPATCSSSAPTATTRSIPPHPLMRALDAGARGRRARSATSCWGRCPRRTSGELVADTVHCPPAEAAPLARLVREKTGGNPFFAIQFLTALHRKGLICVRPRRRAAGAGTSRGSAPQGYTDNVVELMRGQAARRCRPRRRRRSSWPPASAPRVDADDAGDRRSSATPRPRAARGGRGGPAVAASSGDLSLPPRSRAGGGLLADPRARARGGAPRDRPAAAASARRPRSSTRRSSRSSTSSISGAALITSREERERVAELNLMAGKRAQRSTAYASALQILRGRRRAARRRTAGSAATSSRSRSSCTGPSASS